MSVRLRYSVCICTALSVHLGRVAGPLGGGEGTNLLRGTVARGAQSFRPWFGRNGGALRSDSRRSLPRS